MLWEDNYLAHHGIKEQRWGVRRFQNLDGSLTEEGRKRYLPPKDKKSLHLVIFNSMKSIKRHISNSPKPIDRQPIDIVGVKKRGGLDDKEAIECGALAEKIYDRTMSVEPKITRDVVAAVTNSGGDMYGLEHRLKQPTSIAAKIGSDAKDNKVSFETAAGSIRDSLRYTSLSNDVDFVSNYFSIRSRLLSMGYTEARCKNFFDMYRQGIVRHKSIQCVYETPDGFMFEIQYHTPASQAAKNLKLPIYNERRKTGLSAARKAELEEQMDNLAKQVKNPKGVFEIKSH